MIKHQFVKVADRVVVRSDCPFKVYLEGPGDELVALFVGPRVADLRITSFTVPKGYDTVTVHCEADSLTHIDVAPNRFQHADPSTLVKELEVDHPRSVRDIIANEIAAHLARSGGELSQPETVEEANDFEIDDLWDNDEVGPLHAVLVAQDEPGGSSGEPPPPAPPAPPEAPSEEPEAPAAESPAAATSG